MASALARAIGIVVATLIVVALPAVAAAHGLAAVYESPLPLAVYLVGAAATVALSFVFVLARDLRADEAAPRREVAVPRPVRVALRLIGLLGWFWIIAQGIAGGSSDGAVAGLFLWVYGWVGVAMLSALVFPVWEWLDPFATLFDFCARALRIVGVKGVRPSNLPERVGAWPATIGFAVFVWLELVAVPGTSGLTVVLAVYTVVTLALMAQFGRDEWRARGEVFTVWFRTLGRLSATGPAELPGGYTTPDVVVRRPFAEGVLDAEWSPARIVLVAFGVASIIFDGTSQTVPFAAVFGAPSLLPKTLLLIAFLGIVAVAALQVARDVSPGAIGAGLLPIAVGYLVAHYLTFLLVDGQRILIAISDPLQTGADYFGTAFWKVSAGWLPPGLIWTVQLAAVVGGHMLGAWSGHVTAGRDIEAARNARDMRHRKIHDPVTARNLRMREIPLAVMMVILTTITLWSLGQAIVKEQASSGAVPAAPAAVSRPV
jgi:hypothetical protein